MFTTLKNAFKIKDIRNKIFFTFLMLAIVRLGTAISAPGIKSDVFTNWYNGMTSNKALGFMDRFTGGSFEKMSILALNITPYITSSIIIQLLTIAIPKLEELQHDGEEGRKKLTAYTRRVTIALALIESIAMAISIRQQISSEDAIKECLQSAIKENNAEALADLLRFAPDFCRTLALNKRTYEAACLCGYQPEIKFDRCGWLINETLEDKCETISYEGKAFSVKILLFFGTGSGFLETKKPRIISEVFKIAGRGIEPLFPP